ncbi:MAG TPA: hypothetical protein ENG03_00430 [Thioploca sp.]|nr:MAG: hypothetical protein DRR19_17890 [Gammaproteobacteria bacterium]HDN25568.1 hypothetical protein [Thioploca sp.]
MRVTNEWVEIQAQTLTPFYYHGLYARDGSATHPDIITDTALMFALQAALLPRLIPILRATPDYRADLTKIPWRTSLLWGENNDMMAPVRHTIDVEREGGNHENLQKNMASGYFKKTFFVHEVAIGARYHGFILGINPFKLLKTDKFIIRIGVGRLGMLEISRNDNLKAVRLNTATAKLFERDLPEAYRIIDTIRVSQPFSIGEARDELRHWV